jgi:hypothetical protein
MMNKMPLVSELRKQKVQRRMPVIRKGRKSRRSALALQRRVSLVGNRKWRITNLNKVLEKWA